jgi:hypothetical protein
LRGKAVRCSIADRNVDLASCSVTVDVDTGGYAIVRFRDGEWVSTESSEK